MKRYNNLTAQEKVKKGKIHTKVFKVLSPMNCHGTIIIHVFPNKINKL